MTASVLYVTTFAGTGFSETLWNGTTLDTFGYPKQNPEVLELIHKLPNGTVIDMYGSNDAPIAAGTYEQGILIKAASGAKTTLANIRSRFGKRGTLTGKNQAGTTVTCTARMIGFETNQSVYESDPFATDHDKYQACTVTFRLLTNWA